jgi:hypothetical protein
MLFGNGFPGRFTRHAIILSQPSVNSRIIRQDYDRRVVRFQFHVDHVDGAQVAVGIAWSLRRVQINI